MKLKHTNTLLVVAIILINIYTLALPLLPAASFWWENRTTDKKTELAAKVLGLSEPAEGPRQDSLIAPTMLLDQPIHEGNSEKTLKKGLWRKPSSSTPDQGGNTVIVGHRFTYTDPEGTLYHLDKVRPGDQLALWWNGKKYVYTVSETKTVSADAVEIEAPTQMPTLTLYTCTPLWNPKDRLVVTALLEENI